MIPDHQQTTNFPTGLTAHLVGNSFLSVGAMPHRSSSVGVAFLLAAAAASGWLVQGATSFKHPLHRIPRRSLDVTAKYSLPKHPDLAFPIGEWITVRCHLSTALRAPINVTYMIGSLNSPLDFGLYLQNYSLVPVTTELARGDELVLEYTFKVHEALEPIDYQIALTVFYKVGFT